MVTAAQLKLLTDQDLLASLCNTIEDQVLYVEFVGRFLPEVKEACEEICEKRKIDLQVGQQIAHETFEKLRKYKSFHTDKVKAPATHKSILLYLFKICRNLFNDWHNEEKKKREPYIGKSYFDGLLETIVLPEQGNILAWKRDVAVKILKKLNVKEQRVVLTDIEHKQNSPYLSDEVTEELALTLGVQKGTVRKIRERAIQKIKNTINEINQS